MLVVAQNTSCARAASIRIGDRVTGLGYLSDTLCVGPLRCERVRRRFAWKAFAREREDYWRQLAHGECNPVASWGLLRPSFIEQFDRVLVAVQRDSNGWLNLAMLLAICRIVVPPARWHILWCAKRDNGERDIAVEEPRQMMAVEREDAMRLWGAATSDSPEALAGIDPASSIGYTAQCLLNQLPAEDSGLTTVDHGLLALCAEGPTKINRIIGSLIMDLRRVEAVMSEWYFGDRMARLLAADRAPVRVTSLGPDWWKNTVEITDFGADILAGRASLLGARTIRESVCGFQQLSSPSSGGEIWVRGRSGGVARCTVVGPHPHRVGSEGPGVS